ncbi:MAG: tetratricopeptide repeat protein, partial [Candidatus Heimdallarchaeota archaeon]|nr:tetratricopeptide repeat protein [Candidatus Heimdallarchaeota archaeon]
SQRVFLTLSELKITIPELAVEAVLLRPYNELTNVTDAIKELINSSLVEEVKVSENEYFLCVPFEAQIFGRKMLAMHLNRGSIYNDVKLIRKFGIAQQHDVSKDVDKRMRILFKNIAKSINEKEHDLQTYLPIVQYVARKIPKAWLYLAELLEQESSDKIDDIEYFIKQYVTMEKNDIEGWKKLANFYYNKKNRVEEINALVSLTSVSDCPINIISNSANRVNFLISQGRFSIEEKDKKTLINQMATNFHKVKEQCNADDLSRLAWLYMNLREYDKAKKIVSNALEKDPDNIHCKRFSSRMFKVKG